MADLSRNRTARTGDYSRYWAERDYLRDAGKVRAASCWCTACTTTTSAPGRPASGAPRCEPRASRTGSDWHQGGHGGYPPARLVSRWFDHYLYDAPNGVEDGPHALVEREDGSLVREQEWPDPAATDVAFSLAPRGDGDTGGLTEAPAGTGVDHFVDSPRFTPATLVERGAWKHGLLYRGARLGTAWRLSGTPRATLELAFTARAANLTVALLDLGRRGAVRSLVTEGWADPQNRSSLTSGEALEPGTSYGISVDLEPNDHVFPAGHRVGVVVMSTDRDATLLPPGGTGVGLDVSQSSVVLPLDR